MQEHQNVQVKLARGPKLSIYTYAHTETEIFNQITKITSYNLGQIVLENA